MLLAVAIAALGCNAENDGSTAQAPDKKADVSPTHETSNGAAGDTAKQGAAAQGSADAPKESKKEATKKPPANNASPKPKKPLPPSPTSLADALERLDLRSLPLAGKTDPQRTFRSAGELNYATTTPPIDAVKFHIAQLEEQGWQVVPESRRDGVNPSAILKRDGYIVDMSAMKSPLPSETKTSMGIRFRGNVAMSSLPKPTGASRIFANDMMAMYETKQPHDDTVKELHEALVAAGWRPHGVVVDSWYYQQNSMRLHASITTHPNRPGITFVNYTTTVLSAIIPIPPDCEHTRYEDRTKTATFHATPDSLDQVIAFYRDSLSKAGWSPTTDKMIEMNRYSTMIFRNDTKDMLELQVRDGRDTLRFTARHSSAAELEAMDEQLRLAAEKDAASSSTPPAGAPPLTTADAGNGGASDDKADDGGFPVPTGANKVQRELEIGMVIFQTKLPVKEVFDFYRGRLQKLGWQEQADGTFAFAEENVGAMTWEQGDKSIQIAVQSQESEFRSRVIAQGDGLQTIGGPQAEDGAPNSSPPEADGSHDEDSNANDEPAALRVADFTVGKCEGQFQRDGSLHRMRHALAYAMKESGEMTWTILLSEKPFNTAKLKGKKVDGFLVFDLRADRESAMMVVTVQGESVTPDAKAEGDQVSVSCHIGGRSVHVGMPNFQNKVRRVDDRLKGELNSGQQEEGKLAFSVEIDVPLMTLAADEPNGSGLVASDMYDVPVPEEADDVGQSGTRYRKEIIGSCKATLKDLAAFFEAELADDWKQEEAGASASGTSLRVLRFSNATGRLELKLEAKGSRTNFSIDLRNTQAAKKDGMLPVNGKGRVILGNAANSQIEITLAGKRHVLKAGVGSRNPADAIKVDLPPGKHIVEIKAPGQKAIKETIELKAGMTWGVISIGEDAFVERLF